MRSYKVFILFLLLSISVFSVSYKGIIMEGIDPINYPKIKVNLIGITDTNKPQVGISLTLAEETREGSVDPVPVDDFVCSEMSEVSSVNIDGQEYTVTNNIANIGGEDYFVHRWSGTYDTSFEYLERKDIILSFNGKVDQEQGVAISNPNLILTGTYPEAGAQYIYSQITKENLIKIDQYMVNGLNEVYVSAIDMEESLGEFLTSDTNYDETQTQLSRIENERYNYNGEPKSLIKFKLIQNTGAPKDGGFNLTQLVESGNEMIYKKLIDKNYKVPAPTANFREEDLESSKNTFFYDEDGSNKLEHLMAYKYQEVVFRLYNEITPSQADVRSIKKIETGSNLSEFLNENNNYIDFVFENNGSQQEIIKDGIRGKFIDGKFELMGLENGKSYNLDFYTLRYKNNNTSKNYVVVTNEGSLGFIGKNILNQSRIMLEDINTENYNEIQINLITISNKDLEKIELLQVEEIRNGIPATYPDITIATKIGVENIWVDGQEYTVDGNNQIYIDGKNQFVYRWTGSYDTSFAEEEGEIRSLTFTSRRYLIDAPDPYKVKPLSGKYMEPVSVIKDDRYPHQRVFFDFKHSKNFENQDYQIEDRLLIPERMGYRQMKTIDYDQGLKEYLSGKKSHINKHNFSYANSNWNYPAQDFAEGLVIEKTITDSKGDLVVKNGKDLKFYTDDTGTGIEKLEQNGNKVVYRWNEGPVNSNGEILTYDKVMFRIVKGAPATESVGYMVGEENKSADLPKYYWNPYEKTNPINSIDGTDEGNLRLEAFLFGNPAEGTNQENYIDLVLNAKKSKEMVFNNALISYEATNKNLRIVGLPIGDYTIQFYSTKKGHRAQYKVVTYENQEGFHMDIPQIASEEFDKENNIHKTDFITTTTSNGAIQVNVNLITKMEREIELTTANLQSINLPDFKLAETNEGTVMTEGVGETEMTLNESTQKRFLFPLDIVFAIDNSGSMQNEINSVRDGLTAFGQELYNRGFDVKYNLITFGPVQDSSRIGDWNTKVAHTYDINQMTIYKDKWFDGVTMGEVTAENRKAMELQELQDALGKITASGGYNKQQENSAWAIHYAIEKLRANGRYLDYSGEITESGGYMPSQKMIIFLTDENMDAENVAGIPEGGYANNSSDSVLSQLYAKLNGTYNGVTDNINLTGLFHIKKDGNEAAETVDGTITFYEKIKVKPYSEYGNILIPEYKYTTGNSVEGIIEYVIYSAGEWVSKTPPINKTDYDADYAADPDYRIDAEVGAKVQYSKREWGQQETMQKIDWDAGGYASNSQYKMITTEIIGDGDWLEYDDREASIFGVNPSDIGDISHTDFKYYNTGNNFFMYEMGTTGGTRRTCLNGIHK